MTARVGDRRINDHGSELVLTAIERRRETVGYVSRANGAYLVSVSGDLTDDATPDETYTAASSLDGAKRAARTMAEDFGYTGAPRWRLEGVTWLLELTQVDELWRYADGLDEPEDDDEDEA